MEEPKKIKYVPRKREAWNKLTQEEYEQRVFEKYNGVLEVHDKYIDWETPILHYCKTHQYEYPATPASVFAKKYPCTKCSGLYRRTDEEYKQELKIKYNGNITINEKFTLMKNSISHHCNIHNFDFPATPKDMLDSKKVYGCPVCANKVILKGVNDLWTTAPQTAALLKDPEDAYRFTYSSDKKTNFECPICKETIFSSIGNVTYHGLSCPRCSDGISYPEKFMYEMLTQLDIKFDFHKYFKWSNNKVYDFFIPKNKVIIETHGSQHYDNSFEYKGGRTLEEEQENDLYKYNLAIENNIANYIIIDCRESSINWIRNSILNSILPLILDFKESDIDWDKCAEYASSNLLLKACEMWNDGKVTDVIAKELQINVYTIEKYLIAGTEIGLCKFDLKTERKRRSNRFKSVVCVETDEMFLSINDAIKSHRINSHGSIGGCCKHKRKYTYSPRENRNVTFRYYEEYITLSKEEILEIIKDVEYSDDRIVCVETEEVFTDSLAASLWCGTSRTAILSCVNGAHTYSGKHPKTGVELHWMHYRDYMEMVKSIGA